MPTCRKSMAPLKSPHSSFCMALCLLILCLCTWVSPDKSYLDHVMHGDLVDDDVCQHVTALKNKYMAMDAQVKQGIEEMQDAEIEKFNCRRQAFANRLPSVRVGDYVFEIKESPKPMQSTADGPLLVVARYKDQATLRTGVTKWDPAPKEIVRKVNTLAPCLTRRQAVAKAYSEGMSSNTREAPLVLNLPGHFLELSFSYGIDSGFLAFALQLICCRTL